jgi:hypothetical protein
MAHFCDKCGADEYICQECGTIRCSADYGPEWLKTERTGREGNVCPPCFNGDYTEQDEEDYYADRALSREN